MKHTDNTNNTNPAAAAQNHSGIASFFSNKKYILAAAAAIVIIVAIVLATSLGSASSSTSTSKDRGIGLEKSVAVALNDAGYTQGQVTDLKGSFDKDDGVAVYDVYFIANGYAYEYTIQASNGDILDSEIKTPSGDKVTGADLQNQEDAQNQQQSDGQNQSGAQNQTASQNQNDISLDKAKELALSHAGVKASAVTFTKTKQDYDDGKQVYEIEFYKESTEYEYEIDAATGDILSFSKEAKGGSNSGSTGSGSGSSGSGNSQPSSNYIGVDKAKSIALKDAGVSASNATFTKAKLDRDDGIYEYEVEFYAGDTEYEYTINALTGDILDWDRERLDWDD